MDATKLKKNLEEIKSHADAASVLLNEIAAESSYAAVSLMIINTAELSDSADELLKAIK